MPNSKAGIIEPIDKCRQRNTQTVYRNALSETVIKRAGNGKTGSPLGGQTLRMLPKRCTSRLNRYPICGGKIMPTLEWIGKDKVVNHHQEVPYRVLERQYSYDEAGQHAELSLIHI